MFWGLIMEPGRCYTQTVKVSFHVSMAALDISNSSDEPSQIMCVFEGRNYLLCTLNKKDRLQCALDLNFEAGSKVSFATNGKSHVHLTGYLTGMDDELEEEEVEEEEVVTNKKEKKRPKKQLTEGPPKKKTKTIENDASTSNQVEEEEDSSDSDFDVNKLVNETVDEEEDDDEDEEEGEEEESEEDGEEEASSLSEAESEEEQQKDKPKQNGIPKAGSTPLKKKKQEQEQEKSPKEKPKKKEQKKEQKQPKPQKTTLKGGVVVQDLKEGSGEVVKSGKFVHVYYEGRLKENNKMFDSTTKGPGFSFRVGKGEVIRGWDIGLVGMKVGGKRRLICPPGAAYGVKGSPPVIPPNATLVFDVEIKKVS